MTAKERLIKKIAQSMDDAPDAFFGVLKRRSVKRLHK